jgi:kanamycin kinase
LKAAAAKSLAREAEMGAYFHKKGLAPEVLFYESGERDLLLTARAEGEDGTHPMHLSDPNRLAHVMGETLRALHETEAPDCPVKNRMGEYLALADENYALGKFDAELFLGKYRYSSAKEARAVLCEGRDLLKNEVLLHGDYCLPNVFLSDDGIGFLDLGSAGVMDKDYDVFMCLWSMRYNFVTLGGMSEERFAVCKSVFFEALGESENEEKLRFHRLLDEFFV